MSNLPSKGVALITSASKASAPSIRDRLAKLGYDVILVARKEAGLRALFRAPRPWHGCSGRSPSSPSDVENRTSLASVARQISAQEKEPIIDGLSTEKEKSTCRKNRSPDSPCCTTARSAEAKRFPSRGNRDPDAKCRAGSAAGPVSIARSVHARPDG